MSLKEGLRRVLIRATLDACGIRRGGRETGKIIRTSRVDDFPVAKSVFGEVSSKWAREASTQDRATQANVDLAVSTHGRQVDDIKRGKGF